VKERKFGPAFSDALASYMKLDIKDTVTRAVRELVWGKDEVDDSLGPPLFDIIKNNRLRM
jgi:hypothetical protein